MEGGHCYGFSVLALRLYEQQAKLADFNALDTRAICDMKQGTGKEEINAGGVLTGVRVLKSKKGDLYAQCVLEDMAGAVRGKARR